MSARTRRTDWILWGALACTLIGTAHAEYTLATATGVHWFVAASVPGALDLYVIRALQVHRDVLAAVLAMVVMNVASHLVTAGVLPVHWALISAVGALAPLVLWRIHYLWREGARSESALGEGAPETSALPPDYLPDWVQEQVHSQIPGAPPAPPHPPAVHPASAPAPRTVSAVVPPTAPAHSAPGAVHPDVKRVLDSDKRRGRRSSMRALRAEYGWGQDRATSARKEADEYPKGVQP